MDHREASQPIHHVHPLAEQGPHCRSGASPRTYSFLSVHPSFSQCLDHKGSRRSADHAVLAWVALASLGVTSDLDPLLWLEGEQLARSLVWALP